MNARFKLLKHHKHTSFTCGTKYHYVKENKVYSNDFIWAIYGFIKLITYSCINIFKNMFKIHCEIGPLVI